MKKLTIAAIICLLFNGCRKENVDPNVIDTSKNPRFISVTVDGVTSEIIVVR